MGVASLLSLDPAIDPFAAKLVAAAKPTSSSMGVSTATSASVTIPPEGFLAGATLLAFDSDGILGAEPDFWVVADEGFDFYRDVDGNLILLPANIRTLGSAASPITGLAIAVTPAGVERNFANVFDPPTSAASNVAPASAAAGTESEPLEYYFAAVNAAGESAVFGAYLVPNTTVPEPSTIVLLLVGLASVGRVRRVRS